MATSTHKHYLYAAFFVLTLALIFSVAEGRLNKQRQATFQIHRNYNTIVYNRIKSADSRLMERNDSRNNDHASTKTDSANRWLAGNFQNDYELLKNAITKQSAMDKLQQQQRQYTLDYGFARNRRPLVHDSLKAFAIIGSWTVFFVSGCACESISHLLNVWEHISWLKRIHLAATYLFINLTYIHHWIVGMIFPLFFLIWARSGQCTSARVLEEFFKTKGSPLSEAPKFFYTSDLAKKKSKYKDTGDYVLCLVENWSSAVIPTFAMGLFLCLSRLSKKEKVTAFINAGYPQQLFSPLLLILPALCRVVTRLGAAASLHQYPSLLFELRRNDQPRPVCRSNAYMQRGVSMFLKWIPVAVASDLAVMIILIRQRRNDIGYGDVGPNIAAASLLSIVAPITHLISLMRIIRITRCSAVSLSEATSFQDLGHDAVLQRKATDEDRKVKWRYQLRWRTPKRISETLRSWMNYFLTGHAPLLSMNDWKDHPLRIGEFATEGAYSLFSDRGKTDNSESRQDGDDLTPSADSITESLSLIFRDRDAAIHNATRARYTKHQEAYDTKALYDVLGVAVQQTFDIGLSYDFDHFNPPDSKNVSIHQLRARMAKSAVRQKRELDRQMKEELEVLYRLKKNVVTPKNEDVADDEMKTIQNEIRHRGFDEIESMKTALLTLIPTSALAPEGTEKYESPIMVAEYVNLTAPVENREFKATVESTPDALSIIEEYVRKDFGEEAADAYRQEEIAHRLKERRMLERFRKKYGELKDEADERSQFT